MHPNPLQVGLQELVTIVQRKVFLSASGIHLFAFSAS